MKTWFAVMLALALTLSMVYSATAADNPLETSEKAVRLELHNQIPKDRILNLEQFYQLYQDVMAGKEKAYIIDTRTHPEFYAGHIAGTDHVHAGHVYTIPRLIKDPDAKIVVFCRTNVRNDYFAGMLYKYGYTNVWSYEDGVVGWMKAGYPLVNQFMGKFQVVEYHKEFSGPEKDPFNIREFHPY